MLSKSKPTPLSPPEACKVLRLRYSDTIAEVHRIIPSLQAPGAEEMLANSLLDVISEHTAAVAALPQEIRKVYTEFLIQYQIAMMRTGSCVYCGKKSGQDTNGQYKMVCNACSVVHTKKCSVCNTRNAFPHRNVCLSCSVHY